MFRCKNCNNIDKFELMFSKDYEGAKNYSQKYIIGKRLEISVDGYSFTPSLEFMNEHAVCKFCGQTYIWEYE